ncbi:MAG: transcriptional repressor [Gammaproteobacteria bacterium]|nr:transcriptional repressor [Gammaproteobacteria bacterium]
MNRSVIQNFVATDHDHESCVDGALARAEAVCLARGERLTPLRRRVLELVWGNHLPVKAYDLLAQLSRDGGRRAAPPTVYRALEFLRVAGLVHRLESLNAFIGCARPDKRHSAQFLICTDCGAVAEMDDATLTAKIDANARRLGFQVQDEKIEVAGLCRECATAARGKPRTT